MTRGTSQKDRLSFIVRPFSSRETNVSLFPLPPFIVSTASEKRVQGRERRRRRKIFVDLDSFASRLARFLEGREKGGGKGNATTAATPIHPPGERVSNFGKAFTADETLPLDPGDPFLSPRIMII